MAKFTTFNPELIRSYMEGSDVLDRGIAYMKAVTPGISDASAKEAAIRQAQENCQRRWLNDTTGYIDSEYRAWSEFSNDVRNGRFFNSAYVSFLDGGRDWFLFIICLFLGPFGVHRFIDDRPFTGFLWLCTGGMFAIGWIVDCVNIWRGEF